MDKQFKKLEKEVKLEYTIGSNVIKVDDKTEYLNIIVWQDVTYEDIKQHIV